eukprot:scaffold143343_cov33-Tisochrysis_lutea.AAC.1
MHEGLEVHGGGAGHVNDELRPDAKVRGGHGFDDQPRNGLSIQEALPVTTHVRANPVAVSPTLPAQRFDHGEVDGIRRRALVPWGHYHVSSGWRTVPCPLRRAWRRWWELPLVLFHIGRSFLRRGLLECEEAGRVRHRAQVGQQARARQQE